MDLSKMRANLPTANLRTANLKVAHVFMIAWLASLNLIPFSSSNALLAQRPRFQELSKNSEILEIPRQYNSLLEDAELAIKKKQWGEATLALGTVLGLEQSKKDQATTVPPRMDNRLPGSTGQGSRAFGQRTLGGSDQGQDYFLEADSDGNFKRSMRSKARQMLGAIPEEGAKFVELRYGVSARSALDKAIESNNWEQIAKIAADYSFTEAGRFAIWITAEHSVAQGDLYAAAILLDGLVQQAPARQQFGSELVNLLASCWKGAGLPSRSLEVLRGAKEYLSNGKIQVKGKWIAIDGSDEQLLASLDNEPADVVTNGIKRNSEWLTPMGRPDGNGHSNASSAIFRWQCPMHPSPQDTASAFQVLKNRQLDPYYDIPSRTPLIVGPWVVARTYDQRTVGIDQVTGKVIWYGQFDGAPIRSSVANEIQREPAVSSRVTNSIWAEVANGQLSSDGKNIYGICESPVKQSVESLVNGANGFGRIPVRVSTNLMRAWNLEREGTILWEVGGELGEDEPLLAGAFFLGSPTPYRGELLSLAELNGEVYLLALAPNNGKLVWWQQLVANTSLPIANDMPRNNLAASPAVFGNMVVCPTLSGFTIGYDLSSKSLVWGQRYELTGSTNPRVNAFQGTFSPTFDPHASHSSDYSPIISNGVAVFIPCEPDSSGIYALDLQTGAPIWNQPRQGWRYVGGIWNDKVLLVGDSAATALELRTGRAAWTKPLEYGSAKVVGRGARNGSRYLVPLSSNEIMELDIDTGLEVGRFKLDHLPGNLVATDKALVSLGPAYLSYFILKKRLQKDIDIESLRDPQSLKSLVNKAEILFADGKLEDAFAAIKAAYQKDRDDPVSCALLSKIGIATVRSDFDRFAPLVHEFDSVFSEGLERTAYLTVMIEGYMRQGDRSRALAKLLELAQERVSNRNVSSVESDSIEFVKEHSVQIDRWISSRIERIWEDSSLEEKGKLLPIVSSRVAKFKNESQYSNRRGMRHLLGLPFLAESALESGRDLRKNSDWSAADLLLNNVLEFGDRPLQQAAANELIQIYMLIGRRSSAIRLANRYQISTEPILGSQERTDGDEAFRDSNSMEKKDLMAYSKKASDWPTGFVHVSEPKSIGLGEPEGVPLRVTVHQGEALKDWEIKLLKDELLIRNPSGFESFVIPLASRRFALDGVFNAHVFNNMVYLELPTEIIAIDTLQMESSKAIRWRLPIVTTLKEGSLPEQEKPNNWQEVVPRQFRDYSILAVSKSGLHIRIKNELQCIDLLKGEKVWGRRPSGAVSRNGSRSMTASRVGNTLLIMEPAAGRISTIDCRDGALINTQEYNNRLDIRTVYGWRVLHHSDQKDQRELQLWDYKSQKTLLERRFADRAVGGLFEGKYFIVIETENVVAGSEKKETKSNLYFWNLEAGTENRYELGTNLRIKSVRFKRFGDRIVILPYNTQDDLDGVKVLRPGPESSDGGAEPVVNGPVMAISDQDGHPLWEKPVIAHKFGFPHSQCRNSPVLIFTRRIESEKPSQLGSIAILDVRNGETIFSTDRLRSRRQAGFSHRVNAGTNQSTISFAGESITLQFTDEDRPPSPIGQIGLISLADLQRDENDLRFKRLDQSGDPNGNRDDNPFGRDPLEQDPFGLGLDPLGRGQKPQGPGRIPAVPMPMPKNDIPRNR